MAKVAQERYQKLFSEDVYRRFKEADAEPNLDELLAGAGAAPAGSEPAPAPEQPAEQPAEAPMEDMGGEPEQTDEQKDEEKEEENELHGRISSFLSDVSDMLGPETLRYYNIVEAKAMSLLKQKSKEEIEEILENLPEVGIKIISTSKRSNFIDRDNICYMSVMEAAIDMKEKMENEGSEKKEKPAPKKDKKEDEDEE